MTRWAKSSASKKGKHLSDFCGFLFCLKTSGQITASYRRPKAEATNKIITVHLQLSEKLEQTDTL